MNTSNSEFAGHRDRFRDTDKSAGNGEGTRSRLRAVERQLVKIETRMESMATKEDIQAIKTLIAERESKMLRWLIGICSIGAISLVVALVRTLIN